MRRTGKGGSQHEEMVDYFYYAQLVAQGENATADRYPPPKKNTIKLPLTTGPVSILMMMMMVNVYSTHVGH